MELFCLGLHGTLIKNPDIMLRSVN
ncbi:hypothetical protein Gorai_009302 [Gossypium raimondii]|uniref:Uncharacterized protein n=1 Tax=Gossypium raimondii TaxID=29730 RepID=A0A7J8PSQ0_GOSRA|nr:hypothetical protein [Gossypium raimondii]